MLGAKRHRLTYTECLLALLLANKGRRVSLPDVQRAAGAQHGARLAEIRAKGFVIVNEMEHAQDGTHSFYTLIAGPGEAAQLPLEGI